MCLSLFHAVARFASALTGDPRPGPHDFALTPGARAFIRAYGAVLALLAFAAVIALASR